MSSRAVLLFASCALARAQTFEAASIKPSPIRPPNVIQSPANDPGHIHYTWMPLKRLIMNAYDVKDFQISGPDWLATTRFDLEATMLPSTTKQQFRAMLQSLLAERFKLAIHRATKELPIYSLVIAKGGPKMKESQESSEDAPVPAKRQTDNFGFPIMPEHGAPRMMELAMKDRARLVAYQQTTQDLADHLGLLSRPVFDATGLTAKYNFTLTFSLEGLSIAPQGVAPSTDIETPPDLFSALQSQLGLKLESKKGPVDLIVIDHIEKTPVEN